MLTFTADPGYLCMQPSNTKISNHCHECLIVIMHICTSIPRLNQGFCWLYQWEMYWIEFYYQWRWGMSTLIGMIHSDQSCYSPNMRSNTSHLWINKTLKLSSRFCSDKIMHNCTSRKDMPPSSCTSCRNYRSSMDRHRGSRNARCSIYSCVCTCGGTLHSYLDPSLGLRISSDSNLDQGWTSDDKSVETYHRSSTCSATWSH